MSHSSPGRPSNPRIVFLDRETLPPQTYLRPPAFAHESVVYPNTKAEEVAERIRDADIVITNKVPLTEAALDAAHRLRLVAVAATGVDNIDLRACQLRDISVCNVRNYALHSVPEHAFALIFALRRNLLAYSKSVQAGRWADSGMFCFFDHPIRDLAGATLGIIGAGVLGKAVGQIGHALGMKVLFAARKGSEGMSPFYTPFEAVLEQSDVISLHCPLTPATRGLIGAAEFERMVRCPLLINTARGGLVDEGALIIALNEGRISGAGFDVATEEPPTESHPLWQLVGRADFILTPHVAWASNEAVQTLADQLIDNIDSWYAHAPRNNVVVNCLTTAKT